MPKNNTTSTKMDLNISPEDLAKISDPFGMAKEWLKSENGSKLLKEVKDLQQDLKKEGLNLEDYLIVGNKTLKDATKNWEKKNLNKSNNLAIYATLYIAACNKKDVPVTFVCPKDGLKKKERNFNFNSDDILKWKDEVKNTVWDRIWDSICSAFGVVTPHSKELMAQEHRLKIDEIRTRNLQKEFTKETAEKYRDAKDMIQKVTDEENKWEKLFLKEGEEKLPELPEEMKEKLAEPYKSMTPIEMCMALTARRISFHDSMTPESVSGSELNQIKEVGEMYRSFVKDGNLKGMKQELRKEPMTMSFVELGETMEEAAKQPGCGPAVEVDGKRNVNTKYNPFSNEKVREKAISLMPMLKHSSNKRDTQSIGTMMAKHFYGMMENSAKMYEAVQERRMKDYLPIASRISNHNAFWTIARNMVVLDANKDIDKITKGRDGDLSSVVRVDKLTNINEKWDGYYSTAESKQRYQSPLGTAMLFAKCGFEGSMDQFGYTEEGKYGYSTVIDNMHDAWNRARLIASKVNEGVLKGIQKADKEYGEVEVQKEVKTEMEHAEPETELEQEELGMGGM